MSISIPNADYTPQLTGYTGQGAFRFWCQKVLPIVYDDSLSYYELLNKVVNYLNNVIADVASVENNIEQLNTSYVNLQKFVNDTNDSIEGEINEFETDMLDRYRTFAQRVTERVDQLQDFVTRYFENLNVQQEINHKLDEMASDGSLTELIRPLVASDAPDIIREWMDENITPTQPVIDASLSVSGAGADAKVTGDYVKRFTNNYISGKFTSLDYNKITLVPAAVEDTVAGSIGDDGNFLTDNTKTIYKIPVSEGEFVFIDENTTVWQFQSATYIPYVDNPNIIGNTNVNMSGFFEVPKNAIYLMLVKNNDDTNSYAYKIAKNIFANEELTQHDFIQGSYTTINGKYVYNRSRVRLTTAIPLDVGADEILEIKVPTGYQIALGIAKSDNSVIEEVGFTTYFIREAGYYYKVFFSLKNDEGTNIIASDVDSTFTFRKLKKQPKKTNYTNYMPRIIDDGYYMDLDGMLKQRSASSDWVHTDFCNINPNLTYKIYSYIRKNKVPGNIYVSYFDSEHMYIRSQQVTAIRELSVPENACYLVFSGGKKEITYLYFGTKTPTVFPKSAINKIEYFSKHNPNNTAYISYAKMGMNYRSELQFPTYPHGSKYAFIDAVLNGFNGILIDVIPTSDGKLVVSHDDNLYPLATLNDGSPLPTDPYSIREHTFAEIKALDMGYNYGEMFHGTRILTMEEALSIIKKLNVTVIIEPEYSLGIEGYRSMAEKVKEYGFNENVIFFSYYKSELEAAKSVIPNAGLMIYAGSTEAAADYSITGAIELKTSENRVFVNAFAVENNNVLTSAQLERMINNGIEYSVSTPNSEPYGFLSFMENAPHTDYVTLFGTRAIPAVEMLTDNVME